MIPPWPEAVDCALAHLAEDGRLHIVDFGQSERLPAMCRTVLFAWLRQFHVLPRAELRACLQERASRAGLDLQFASEFRGYAWSASLSRQPLHPGASSGR